jgi:4-amino-4-deoxy-L-arabinose transferase-like glycosyltransferase
MALAPLDGAALLLLLAAALALRLWGVDSESIWLDEATSIFLARMPLADMVRWTAADIHPPLYYALLHAWLTFGDSEVVVRSLSVVSGACAIPLIYLLAQRLFNRRVALGAAVLLATSPLHVWYSQETRMYALLATFALASTYCMVRALLDGRRWAWLAYVALTILSLYTHYYTVFVLLFQNLAAVYLVWQGQAARRAARTWLLAQAVCLLAFAPWLPVLLNQVRSGGGAWVERAGAPGLGALSATAINFTIGPDVRSYSPLLRRVVYVVFGLLCLVGLLAPLRRAINRRNDSSAEQPGSVVLCSLYLFAPLAAAWAVSQVKPLYSLRYLLPFVPAYYILIARGLDSLLSALAARPALRLATWALAITALASMGLVGVAGAATRVQATDWRVIADRIVTSAEADDIVVFVPGWNVKPFDYYARGRVGTYGDTPIPITVSNASDVVAKAAVGRSRLWFVHTTGHYADADNYLGSYLDATATRLDEQRFAGDISVSLYRLKP